MSDENSLGNYIRNVNIATGYHIPEIFDSTDDESNVEFVYRDNMGSQFGLDENLEITWTSSPLDSFDEDSINHDEVRKEIYEMLAPVIDNISEPTINLQSLFNFLNRDKYIPID